jgi:hypothetical protein
MVRGMRREFCVNCRLLIFLETQQRKVSENALNIRLNRESHHLPGVA